MSIWTGVIEFGDAMKKNAPRLRILPCVASDARLELVEHAHHEVRDGRVLFRVEE